MYIVAIAWIYVTLMVSVAQPSALRGILTFVGTGLLPLALFLWLVGTPQRRRNRARAEARMVPEAAAAESGEEPVAPDAATRDENPGAAGDARRDGAPPPEGASR